MERLTVFPTRTQAGRALADAIRRVGRARLGCEVTVQDVANQWQFFQACMNEDIVVLDATIEDDLERSNYSFATPLNVLRLLVVSRTHTPINFRGIQEGGAAKYSDLQPGGPGGKSNEAIVAWVERQVGVLRERNRQRSIFESLVASIPIVNLAYDQYRSIGAKTEQLKGEEFIFLSYRSTRFHGVRNLAGRIRGGELGGELRNSRLFFFDPGELVYDDELLSPLRRWQLLSLIQDYLIAAKQIWLYLSDDYLDSWWTLGELLSTREFDLTEKLRFYDPGKGHVVRVEPGRLPRVDETQKRRMAHYQANSHPDQFAPETLDRNKMLAPLGDIALVRKLFMMDAPAFSDEFWFMHIVPCRRAPAVSGSGSVGDGIERFYQRCERVDVGAFLKLWNEPELIASVQDLESAAEGKTAPTCPKCQRPIRIVRMGRPRYFWVPQPDSAQTGKAWARLMPLPVYRGTCRG